MQKIYKVTSLSCTIAGGSIESDRSSVSREVADTRMSNTNHNRNTATPAETQQQKYTDTNGDRYRHRHRHIHTQRREREYTEKEWNKETRKTTGRRERSRTSLTKANASVYKRVQVSVLKEPSVSECSTTSSRLVSFAVSSFWNVQCLHILQNKCSKNCQHANTNVNVWWWEHTASRALRRRLDFLVLETPETEEDAFWEPSTPKNFLNIVNRHCKAHAWRLAGRADQKENTEHRVFLWMRLHYRVSKGSKAIKR